jgi:response regulator of citrate/malate metabolism
MIKVLVVDDDFRVAKIHSSYVERLDGFTVVDVAHTGAQALRAVRARRPDLVLLDIYLPDIDGLTVLRELRAAPYGTDTDVVVITAARDAETIQGAIRGGALHYLIKPFSFPALRTQLEHVGSLQERLHRLARGGPAGQREVDDMFASRPRIARGLPKGLSEQTAELVRRALHEHPTGLSASECAQVTGLSRPSARRYLEQFATSGVAVVHLRYGGTGRPERRYHPKA